MRLTGLQAFNPSTTKNNLLAADYPDLCKAYFPESMHVYEYDETRTCGGSSKRGHEYSAGTEVPCSECAVYVTWNVPNSA